MSETDRSERYKDPRWQKLRLSVFERDEFKCRRCGRGDRELHVHHRYYMPRRMPWEYPKFAVLTLCKPCHKTYGDGMSREWERRISAIFGDGSRSAELFVRLELEKPARAIDETICDLVGTWESDDDRILERIRVENASVINQ